MPIGRMIFQIWNWAENPKTFNRVKKLENSLSCFLLNVVLKPNQVKYKKSNFYVFKEDDVWDTMNYNDDSWPKSYFVFYSATPETTEYAEGLTIMTYMSIEEVTQWKNTYNTVLSPHDRGDDYAVYKKEKSEKLIARASKYIDGLEEGILSYYAATPLTFRDYMGTEDGAIYGIAKDYKNPMKTFISPRTKVENLYLTGQNIKLHGILGVAISSLVTLSTILDLEYVIGKIEKEQ